MLSSTGLNAWSQTSWWQLLRRRWVILVASLLVAGLALGGFWYGVERSIRDKEQAARDLMVQRATAQVNSYAVQLEYLSQRLEQVADRWARQWQASPDSVDVQRDVRDGLSSLLKEVDVLILDADGDVAQASFPPLKRSGAQLGYFVAHRDLCCTDWLVVAPDYGPIVGKKVVRFSRRLTGPDGKFGGVLVLAVAPDFLKSFQDTSALGPHDFVSVRLTSGPLVTMKPGSGQPPVVYFKQDPQFTTAQGVRFFEGTEFKDGRGRYVAWRRHPTLPLVAIAAVTERDALASVDQAAAETRAMALITTLALLTVLFGTLFFYAKWTLRRFAEEDVRHTYRVATDAANEGFYMLRVKTSANGIDFCIDDCNTHAAELFGKSRERVVGKSFEQVLPAAVGAEFTAFCQRALHHDVVEDEWRVPTGSGLEPTWLYRRAVHARRGVALTLRDISAAKHHQAELIRIANHDALTGLPNRHWLLQFLPAALERAKESRGQLAVLFVDLDNFKLVNDTLGHDAGDALLTQAAERIRGAVRQTDAVVRWGGDEFTVILERAEHRDAIMQVAAKIVAALDHPFALAGTAANKMGGSVGIAIYPMHGASADLLLKHADVAMYAAKTSGKGRLMLYQPQMSTLLFDRLDRERALREALEQQQFILHYQPRANARSGRLSSFEALVRWQHPSRGTLAPGEFIGLAEETGLVIPLGNQVLDTAVAQLAQWQQQGLPLVPVSINVSPAQLKAGGVAARLKKLLLDYRLPAQWVEVEVTETAIVERSAVVSSELEGLRRLGVRLMIDDFGTGHSSLAQLHRLQVDTLKVDKSFTELLARGSDGELLYEAIISMAAAMHMHVVAEGVETDAQRYVLQSLGCDEIQGFVVSRPVPAGAVPSILRNPQLMRVSERVVPFLRRSVNPGA